MIWGYSSLELTPSDSSHRRKLSRAWNRWPLEREGPCWEKIRFTLKDIIRRGARSTWGSSGGIGRGSVVTSGGVEEGPFPGDDAVGGLEEGVVRVHEERGRWANLRLLLL